MLKYVCRVELAIGSGYVYHIFQHGSIFVGVDGQYVKGHSLTCQLYGLKTIKGDTKAECIMGIHVFCKAKEIQRQRPELEWVEAWWEAAGTIKGWGMEFD